MPKPTHPTPAPAAVPPGLLAALPATSPDRHALDDVDTTFTGLAPGIPEPLALVCVACGCTDDAECPGGCRWVRTTPLSALCSTCASAAKLRALLAPSTDTASTVPTPVMEQYRSTVAQQGVRRG